MLILINKLIMLCLRTLCALIWNESVTYAGFYDLVEITHTHTQIVFCCVAFMIHISQQSKTTFIISYSLICVYHNVLCSLFTPDIFVLFFSFHRFLNQFLSHFDIYFYLGLSQNYFKIENFIFIFIYYYYSLVHTLFFFCWISFKSFHFISMFNTEEKQDFSFKFFIFTYLCHCICLTNSKYLFFMYFYMFLKTLRKRK